MSNLNATIEARMRGIRNNRQLSLDQASKLTGISKAMLSQIERGQSIPTITTLWKIATGYKVPLTYFFEEVKSDYMTVDIHSTEPVFAENHKMRTYTLFPYNPAQNFEMLFIEFDPGCIHESAKHLPYVEEYIYVQSGKLEMHVNQDVIKLKENQCFRFKADVPHAYINSTQKSCNIMNIIFYSIASLTAR